MKIYFAADHAGYELKNILIEYVRSELGYEVEDCGAFMYDVEDDYPLIIARAASKVSVSESDSRAIILGGSGQGEAIAANRFRGVRAAVYYGGNPEIITLSREHNDANILSLGARFIDGTEAKHVVSLWLQTKFSKEKRHVRRIKSLDNDLSR